MIETALDWLERSRATKRLQNLQQRHKRRRLVPSGAVHDNDPNSNDDDNEYDDNEGLAAFVPFRFPVMDPSSAGRAFLYNGTSGIAPLDKAWKLCFLAALGNSRGTTMTNISAGLQHHVHHHQLNALTWSAGHLPPPPLVLLEGPRDTGKTWMLLSLAARFVVATRRSCQFEDDQGNGETDNQSAVAEDSRGEMAAEKSDTTKGKSNHLKAPPQPIVIILNSTYDLTISQLTQVLRSSLMKQYQKHGYQCNEDSGKAKTQQQQQLETDMEDCLGRIHVTQVDDGSGWVAVLEALRHVLRERRETEDRSTTTDLQSSKEQEQNSSTPPPPTTSTPVLLLWDGILSEFSSSRSTYIHETVFGSGGSNKMSEEGSMREVLQQISRLLLQESQSLWLVATMTTATTTALSKTMGGTLSAGHRMVLEWMRSLELQHMPPQDLDARPRSHQLGPAPPTNNVPTCRETCRILLERPSIQQQEGATAAAASSSAGISKSSAFARVVTGSSVVAVNGHHRKNGKRVPYSLSLQGILS